MGRWSHLAVNSLTVQDAIHFGRRVLGGLLPQHRQVSTRSRPA
jgi:hypothetical protein